jgi:anthranilate phosphoribosyltransferase
MNNYLKLMANQRLTQDEAHTFIHEIVNNLYNDVQIASCLSIINTRPIEMQELNGFANALLELCIPVETNYQCMDVCGTGGDGKNTFNISTLSAFVLAELGIKVAKHGNYGVSGTSGSSTVLEKCGYKFSADPVQINHEIDTCGISFMHAPLFHPALKKVSGIRKALASRTFFNMLGPLVNPAQTHFKFCGVFSHHLARIYHHYFQNHSEKYAIVFSYPGYDEICCTGNFKIFDTKGENIYNPIEFNLSILSSFDIYGGSSAEEAFRIFQNVAKGNGTKSQNQVVAINTAFAANLAISGEINVLYKDALNIICNGGIEKKIIQLLKLQS